MEILFHDSGDIFVGPTIGNFTGLRVPFVSWRWPWSNIFVYKDKIILKVWPRTYTILFSEILSIKAQKFSDYISMLRFDTTENTFLLSNLLHTTELLALLKKNHLKIEEIASRNF